MAPNTIVVYTGRDIVTAFRPRLVIKAGIIIVTIVYCFGRITYAGNLETYTDRSLSLSFSLIILSAIKHLLERLLYC